MADGTRYESGSTGTVTPEDNSKIFRVVRYLRLPFFKKKKKKISTFGVNKRSPVFFSGIKEITTRKYHEIFTQRIFCLATRELELEKDNRITRSN